MLENSPGIKYALTIDTNSDPDSVLLMLAIRRKRSSKYSEPYRRNSQQSAEAV